MTESTYAAFVSYSHGADGELSPRIQHALERYSRPWYRLRALRIFRDETGLSVNPGLWSSVAQALDDSEWFVLLASPGAASSDWVNREVEHWCASGRADRILPVLTEGELWWDEAANDFDWERSTAVPAALAGAFSEEPRHLDMRWARSEDQLDLRNGRFRDQIAALAAPMHGLTKDELAGVDVRQHRRALRLAWATAAVVLLLAVAAILGGVTAVARGELAQRSEARALAARDEAEVQRRAAVESAAEAERQARAASASADEAKLRRQEADLRKGQAEASATEALEQQAAAEASAEEAAQSAAEADAQRQVAEQRQAEAAASAEAAQRSAERERQARADADAEAAREQVARQAADRASAEAAAQRDRAKAEQQRAEEAAAALEASQADLAESLADALVKADEINRRRVLAEAVAARDRGDAAVAHLLLNELLAAPAARRGSAAPLGTVRDDARRAQVELFDRWPNLVGHVQGASGPLELVGDRLATDGRRIWDLAHLDRGATVLGASAGGHDAIDLGIDARSGALNGLERRPGDRWLLRGFDPASGAQRWARTVVAPAGAQPGDVTSGASIVRSPDGSRGAVTVRTVRSSGVVATGVTIVDLASGTVLEQLGDTVAAAAPFDASGTRLLAFDLGSARWAVRDLANPGWSFELYQPIATGREARDPVFIGDGSTVVAESTSTALEEFDLDAGTRRPIAPYAAGSLWAVDPTGRSVGVLDGDTMEVRRISDGVVTASRASGLPECRLMDPKVEFSPGGSWLTASCSRLLGVPYLDGQNPEASRTAILAADGAAGRTVRGVPSWGGSTADPDRFVLLRVGTTTTIVDLAAGTERDRLPSGCATSATARRIACGTVSLDISDGLGAPVDLLVGGAGSKPLVISDGRVLYGNAVLDPAATGVVDEGAPVPWSVDGRDQGWEEGPVTTPSGRWIVGSTDGFRQTSYEIFDVEHGDVVPVRAPDGLRFIGEARDGMVLFAGDDGFMRRVDPATGIVVAAAMGPGTTLSSDGSLLARFDPTTHTLGLHDAVTLRPQPTVALAEAGLSPDAALAAMSGAKGSVAFHLTADGRAQVRVVDLANRRKPWTRSIGSFSAHRAVAFSADGRWLMAGTADGSTGQMRVFDRGSGATAGSASVGRPCFDIGDGLGGFILEDVQPRLSPDGALLFAWGAVFDVHSGGQLYCGDGVAFLDDDVVLSLGRIDIDRPGGILTRVVLGAAAQRDRACDLAGRNLTSEESDRYFSTTSHTATCPAYPGG